MSGAALLALLPAALLSAALILLLKPLLVRYALARPNARSSHRVPTPQGGGIAVIGAALAVGIGSLAFHNDLDAGVLVLAGAAIALGAVGAIDDIRPLPALPRLLLQLLAVAAVVAAFHGRILPDFVPLSLERGLLVLAGLWFVNLVNFMDGLDWITAAGMVPVTAAVALVGVAGGLPAAPMLVAAALCGALLGFAPFNRPVAKLFLGDVGSLPIGLIVGWLLMHLAASGALAAAILLPLYHLADASITLLRRLSRGERVWEAHRSHFYQRATDNGFSALDVSARVFGLNLALAALAGATLLWPAAWVQAAALLTGSALVGATLRRFTRPRSLPALTEAP
ncbi:MAG TPA: glycosyl transferase [Microvirga sp.]|jgi:UDP-N-acetylmuramyl pentapeptide phosphotransferase/UDP-N-acetylglucosamine-1-phosphate transferase|nr:glycosyl transferase [Microvirga sp.]